MPADESRFWELPFDPGDLQAIPEELFGAPEPERDPELDRIRLEVLRQLGELVRSALTDKQRRIVELYFYDGLTQQEIAGELRVSQQVVSRQLFGVIRNGQRIGGAINRLRKIAEARGWDPSQWV